MSAVDKRAIFEGMTRTLPVLAFCVNSKGVFREVIANGYTDDLLSEKPSATIGKSIYELFGDEKAELFADNIDQATQTGAVQEFEYSLSIKGKHRTFDAYMAPMEKNTDEDLIIWIAEDITERKERNRELQLHEVFLESIREEVLVTDTDFVITYESAAAPKLYGYDQGERVGDPILQYVHPDDTERVKTQLQEQLTEYGASQPVEFRGQKKDGSWKWVESQSRLLDNHPSVEGVVVTSRDISERVEHRQERKRQHDHLENAENLAQMGGWEYTQDTNTLRWTEGTQDIFDVSDTFEPSLSEATSFYHETDEPIIEEAVEKCLESGVQYSLDAQIITAEGRQRWVQTTGTRSIEDGVTKLRGVIQDITRRKGREQQLAVLNRVLRHNLRNEMSTILGFAEMVEEQFPDEAGDYSSKIIASSERLLSLADKSKQFETAMEYNYTTGPVDLVPLLNDLAAEYREEYADASIITELNPAHAPGNEMGIKLIVEELLENALEHNDADHPKVKIGLASPDPNRGVISIIDNGSGLPENEQEVIQSGAETALKHSDGIGLWTTNWLVSELNGDIGVTGLEGEGTTVTVKLPATKSS